MRKQFIGVFVETDLLARIREMARQDERTLSAAVRLLLRRGMDAVERR